VKNEWFTPAELLPDLGQYVWLRMKKRYQSEDFETCEYETYVPARYDHFQGFVHNEADKSLIITHWQKIDMPEKVKS
jgi:hypothetical protein